MLAETLHSCAGVRFRRSWSCRESGLSPGFQRRDHMPDNRPRGRKKNITGEGKGVHRRGQGTGKGQSGTGSYLSEHSQGKIGSGGSGRPENSGPDRSGSRSMGILPIIIALLVAVVGGGGSLSGLLGGGGSGGSGGSSGGGASSYISSINGGSVSSGWADTANVGQLNRNVAEGAREKYTTIKGNGADTITIMVYMCGTDLESRSGMATADLTEMQNATISNKINLIVYTGGCARWKNNVVSSKVNQIYQIQSGQVKLLSKNEGNQPMTQPSNLTGFINYCKKNFPANRNNLIFWDHGGGSLTGYGYDEKNPRSGSMTLAGINTALKAANMKFDFIGFDACLMATVENAQMLSRYADYMLASEETEPGVGWYYTDWLTKLSANTSMPTLEIGKNIIDDFVNVCAKRCPGQQTTLSIVDLAELEQTLPARFKAFSSDTTNMIRNKEYKTVSGARSGSREFARSSAIDQIDLVHFTKLLGTKEGKDLADALLSSVKYNRTSSNMTNAYGISVYFPYQKASKVDSAAKTYQEIGLDAEYTQCIREFAGLEVSGQIAGGGTMPPTISLGDLLGQGGSIQSSSEIMDILGMFMSGAGGRSIDGLDQSNTEFMEERGMTEEETAAYIANNQFDQSGLLWKETDNGYVIKMSKDQWSLVQGLNVSKYIDDGTGYVDLGLDVVDLDGDFDENGNLWGKSDNTWVSINDQPVAYYHTDTVDDGENYSIKGYVPARLNGEDVKLILIWDNDHEDGYIAGAAPDYAEKVTETEARGLIELKKGDTLEFYCEYYTYDGEYQDQYLLGDPMKVTDQMTISDTIIGDAEDVRAVYRFTDIYNQHYWTEKVPEIRDAR